MKNIIQKYIDPFCTGAALTAGMLISMYHLMNDTPIGNGFYVWTMINSLIAWICFMYRTSNKK